MPDAFAIYLLRSSKVLLIYENLSRGHDGPFSCRLVKGFSLICIDIQTVRSRDSNPLIFTLSGERNLSAYGIFAKPRRKNGVFER